MSTITDKDIENMLNERKKQDEFFTKLYTQSEYQKQQNYNITNQTKEKTNDAFINNTLNSYDNNIYSSF
jgi:hypothetical protein